MTTIRHGVLELADGRGLSFAECGSSDGPTIIYCHGSPGSRREIELVGSGLARLGAPARLIAFDRPGYGRSTPQRRRSFVDWPRDVEEAADQLGVDQFAVLGASGGAPYALACGRELGDRIRRIGIVVGVGPPNAAGMERSAVLTGPSRNALARRLQFGLLAFGFRRGRGDKVVDRSIAMLGEPDRLAMEQQPALREWFGRVFAEALLQGGRESAREAAMYTRDWGFNPADIATESHLFYGALDMSMPASVGTWLHDRLRHSHLTVWPEHGHFTWAVDDRCLAAVVRAVAEGVSA